MRRKREFREVTATALKRGRLRKFSCAMRTTGRFNGNSHRTCRTIFRHRRSVRGRALHLVDCFHDKEDAERNNDEVKKDLDALKKAAEGTDNMLPYILKCVESYCSIGEISNTLRGVWGEY